MMKMQWWWALCLTGLVNLPAVGQEKRPLDIQRAWEMQRLGQPTVSPDGQWVVAPVTRTDMEKDKMTGDLWLFRSDGSGQRRLSSQASSDSSPLFSPDGQYVAFLSKRGEDEANQLYLLPMRGGEAQRLTEVPTGVSGIRWFPDSRSLAFVTRTWSDLEGWEAQGKRIKERKESKMTAKVWDNLVPVTSWDHFVDERESHIYQVSIQGGTPRCLTDRLDRKLPRSGFGRESYDLSPDGKTLVFVSDSASAPGKTNPDLWSVTLGSTKCQNLTPDNPGPDGHPVFSPDGRFLAYARQTIPGFYADRVRLMVRETTSGSTRDLSGSWDRSVGELHWGGDSRSLYSSVEDAGTLRLYQLPLEGKPRPITTQPSYSSLAVSQSQPPVAVALRQSFVEPPRLVKVDLGNGQSQVLSKINEGLEKSVRWGKRESVTYPGYGGQPIQMWVNYPPDFDPTKKYPLFLMIHGGPHNGIPDGMHWRWNAQIFAGKGYVVAWPNFHGSSGFGQEFTDSITADWTTRPYQDILKAAEYFTAQPWIDKDRMVAGGGSYGGYLTTILLGREHPFKALIAHAAVYNLYSQYAADYSYREARHGDFWEAPDRYQKTSPHFSAAHFKTPTLVIHGMLDYRVPVNHGLELYQTLQRLGVPSKLLIFPNENHWILNPQNSVFWYDEVEKWLRQYAPPNS